MKDASATSIWGAKAGNGVIVLTSKRGKYIQPFKLDFSQNTTLTDKPDLYKNDIVSSSDYIDMETYLFNMGYFNSLERSSARSALSPIVETLIKVRDNLMSEEDANKLISNYRDKDVRDEMLNYMYRNALQNQISANISGGSEKYRLLMGVSYNKSLTSQVGNKHDLLLIRLDNAYKFQNGLEISGSLRWGMNTAVETTQTETYTSSGYKYPYISFVDSIGNSLAIPKDYRLNYLDTAGGGRLLDWHYRPYDEINNPPTLIKNHDILFNIGANFPIVSWLKATVNYQYAKAFGNNTLHYDMENYYLRNLINRGTQIQSDKIIYNYPYGELLTNTTNSRQTHNGRFQLTFSKNWNAKHQVDAFLGMDINDNLYNSNAYTVYGYDPNVMTFSNTVDFVNRYPIYNNLGSTASIPFPIATFVNRLQRFLSTFGNINYSFNNRIILSLNGRRDASNLFGVSINNKWTPLWSASAGWLISKEDFFKSNLFDLIKIRSSFGYSGNVDNSLAALPTISYSNINSQLHGIPLIGASLLNAYNPNLRWEKVNNLNLGLDIGFRNKSLTASFDFYIKNTFDLYDFAPLDPSTGISSLTYNSANTRSKGVDIELSSKNFNGRVKWYSTVLFSYNDNHIVATKRDYSGPSSLVNIGALSTLSNTIAFPVYAYKWGGLDPNNGAPMGILNGEPSTNYQVLTSISTKEEDLVYFGSSRPRFFGSFRNTVEFKRFSISANLSYRFDYYFKRQGLNYDEFVRNGNLHSDFYQRWQQPGDENVTDIPAFVYPINTRAENFYKNSEVLIEKGDHIRLHDLKMEYQFPLTIQSKSSRLNLFLYANNIGIIWRANKRNLDPDISGSIPFPRSYSLGINFNY